MEHLFKKNNNLNNQKKKGFTLVELLVVIAILAVLASVSVVGYLGFTTKAKHNNAMSELKQAKEVIRAGLVDGNTHYYNLTIDTSDTAKVTEATEVTENYYNGSKSTEASSTTSTTDNVTTGFTIKYDVTTSNSGLTFTGKGAYKVTWSSLLKALFTDLESINGEFQATVNTTTTTTTTITSLQYFGKNGGKAQWTIKDDSLTNGDSISENVDNKNIEFKASNGDN